MNIATLLDKAREMDRHVKSEYRRISDELYYEKDHVKFLEGCLTFLRHHKDTLKTSFKLERDASIRSYGSVVSDRAASYSVSSIGIRNSKSKPSMVVQPKIDFHARSRSGHLSELSSKDSQNERLSKYAVVGLGKKKVSMDTGNIIRGVNNQTDNSEREKVRRSNTTRYDISSMFETKQIKNGEPLEAKLSGKLSVKGSDHYVSFRIKESKNDPLTPSSTREMKSSSPKIQIKVVSPHIPKQKLANIVKNLPPESPFGSNKRMFNYERVSETGEVNKTNKDSSMSSALGDKISTPGRSPKNQITQTRSPVQSSLYTLKSGGRDDTTSSYKKITDTIQKGKKGSGVSPIKGLDFIKSVVKASRQNKKSQTES